MSEDEGFDWTEGEELPNTQDSGDVQTHYYCRLTLSWAEFQQLRCTYWAGCNIEQLSI